MQLEQVILSLKNPNFNPNISGYTISRITSSIVALAGRTDGFATIIGAGIMAVVNDPESRTLLDLAKSIESQSTDERFPADLPLSENERDATMALYKIGQAVLNGTLKFDVQKNFEENPHFYFILRDIAKSMQNKDLTQLTATNAITFLFNKAIAACPLIDTESEYRQKFRASLEALKKQTIADYMSSARSSNGRSYSFESAMLVAAHAQKLSMKVGAEQLTIADIQHFDFATKNLRRVNKGFEIAKSALLGALLGIAIGGLVGVYIGVLLSCGPMGPAAILPAMLIGMLVGALAGLIVGAVMAIKDEPSTKTYGGPKMFSTKSPQALMINAAENLIEDKLVDEQDVPML